MKLAEISHSGLASLLRAGRMSLGIGPFWINLQSAQTQVTNGLESLYGEFPIALDLGFSDFYVEIRPPRNLRRWLAPQVICLFDGVAPFPPVPAAHSFALLETSLNWYVYAEVYNYLILHAATVEKGGCAAVLPAPPGSGKSTLTAALVNRGWRLLTDELTLVDLQSLEIWPLARPISLKNQSIAAIQEFAPASVIGGLCHGTVKGTIGYMRPPRHSVARMNESAPPRWMIFPQYDGASSLVTEPLGKAKAFSLLPDGLVNYAILGTQGFAALTALLEQVDCFNIRYGDLDEAVEWFERLSH